MKNNNSLILCVLTALVAFNTAFASDPIPAAKQKKPIALVGGTIHTVSGAVISNGTILFDKGKIVAVGQTVSIPADAERINIAGKHVYPGIIDSYSNMGLTEIGSVRGTQDGREQGSINPNARAEVAVDAESELFPVARSGGILVSASSPGGGLISGTSAALMMDGWTYEDMTLKAPLGLIVNWPPMVYEQGGGGFFGGNQMSKENWLKRRDSQIKELNDAFADARAYMVAKKAEAQKGVPYHDTDSRWEAMIPVLEGRVPVFIEAGELAQIQAAITWAEQQGVKLVIVGGRDAWKVTDQLKAKNIPVIVQPILFAGPPHRYSAYDEIYSLPNKLKQAGVRFSISGDGDASNSRNIPHHAATAAAFGLPTEDALKAVTLYAAEILGIADHVGSLETGKDATLLITNGDPLELSTFVEQAYIQGKKIDMRDKHKRLYQKYQEKYKQLSGK